MTTPTAPRHEYRDTRGAADYTGISPHTLACWRSRREGPAWCRAGRLIRYRMADLDAWLESRRRDPSRR